MENMIHSIKTYGMFATNTALPEKSSSGGIFPLLAEEVILNGGTVFGAAFCENFKSVKHIAVNCIEELPKIQGSKYLKSDFVESFARVQELLEKELCVLFSGTPCQISALKKYLKKEYSNLLTVAVICHGTPKNNVWHDYITELESKYKSKVIDVNFRNKSKDYRKYSLCIQFANGKKYCKSKDHDVYMCGFLQNMTLEKRCFDCHFKGDNIEADIILGDFWGVERVVPELCHNGGTSLVIVRSEKGIQAVESKLSDTKYREVELTSAINHNSSLYSPAKIPENYESFFRAYDSKKCSQSIKKFLNRKNYILLFKNKLVNVISNHKYSK